MDVSIAGSNVVPEAAEAPIETGLNNTIFNKLGGFTALQLAVAEFYRRILSDPLLAPYFEGISMESLHRKQIAFMAFAFGGPSMYIGRTIDHAHRAMILERGLGLHHFDAVAGHFVATLQELGVREDIIQEAAATVLTVRPMFDREALLKADAEDAAQAQTRIGERLMALQKSQTSTPREPRAQKGTDSPQAHETSQGAGNVGPQAAAADRLLVSTLVDVLAHQRSQAASAGATPRAASEAGASAASTAGTPRTDSQTLQGGALPRSERRAMIKGLLQDLGVLHPPPPDNLSMMGTLPTVLTITPTASTTQGMMVVATGAAGVPQSPNVGSNLDELAYQLRVWSDPPPCMQQPYEVPRREVRSDVVYSPTASFFMPGWRAVHVPPNVSVVKPLVAGQEAVPRAMAGAQGPFNQPVLVTAPTTPASSGHGSASELSNGPGTGKGPDGLRAQRGSDSSSSGQSLYDDSDGEDSGWSRPSDATRALLAGRLVATQRTAMGRPRGHGQARRQSSILKPGATRQAGAGSVCSAASPDSGAGLVDLELVQLANLSTLSEVSETAMSSPGTNAAMTGQS